MLSFPFVLRFGALLVNFIISPNCTLGGSDLVCCELDYMTNSSVISKGLININCNALLIKNLTDFPPLNENFKEVKAVEISGTNLKEISSENFKFLTGLRHLNLSGNKITKISQNLFKNNENLKVLDLSGNGIDKIEPGVFDNLKILKSLNLSQNNLSKINSGMLENLESLEDLSFSYNSLERINSDDFKGLKALKVLDLNHNSITKIDSTSFDSLENLQTIKFTGNPCADSPYLSSPDKKYLKEQIQKYIVEKCASNDESTTLRSHNYSFKESIKSASSTANFVLIFGIIQTIVICLIVIALVIILKRKKNQRRRIVIENAKENVYQSLSNFKDINGQFYEIDLCGSVLNTQDVGRRKKNVFYAVAELFI